MTDLQPADLLKDRGDRQTLGKRVVVVGAGYIGAVLAGVLAESGCSVSAVDIDPRTVSRLNAGRAPVNEPGLNELIARAVADGRLRASSELDAVADAEVILVTVGTPLGDDGSADTSHLATAVEAIAAYVRPGQLVIVKSTVPPYTTERLVAPVLRKRAPVHVAFCPERLAEGNAIYECRHIPVVVGGVDEASTRAAAEFWRQAIGVETIAVDSARAAELVKLADNAWIDLNIAMSFELARLADRMRIDVLPVIAAANSLPKGQHHVNILTPSVGVGGYCLTKDPWFLHAFAREHGSTFETAALSRRLNDQAPLYAAARIDTAVREAFGDGDPAGRRIAVLGLAFKSNTGDCRFTPTAPAVAALRDMGYDVLAHDPWVDAADAAGIGAVALVDSAEDAARDAHAVAFLSGHREFHALAPETIAAWARPGAVVFDGRMFFSAERIARFRELGLRVRGVGR